jgi:hypothetical protein
MHGRTTIKKEIYILKETYLHCHCPNEKIKTYSAVDLQNI